MFTSKSLQHKINNHFGKAGNKFSSKVEECKSVASVIIKLRVAERALSKNWSTRQSRKLKQVKVGECCFCGSRNAAASADFARSLSR